MASVKMEAGLQIRTPLSPSASNAANLDQKQTTHSPIESSASQTSVESVLVPSFCEPVNSGVQDGFPPPTLEPTHGADPEQLMTVYVSSSNFETFDVTVSQEDTISDVKFMISHRTRVAQDDQRLVFCGKPLEKDALVGDLNIKNGSILILFIVRNGMLDLSTFGETSPVHSPTVNASSPSPQQVVASQNNNMHALAQVVSCLNRFLCCLKRRPGPNCIKRALKEALISSGVLKEENAWSAIVGICNVVLEDPNTTALAKTAAKSFVIDEPVFVNLRGAETSLKAIARTLSVSIFVRMNGYVYPIHRCSPSSSSHSVILDVFENGRGLPAHVKGSAVETFVRSNISSLASFVPGDLTVGMERIVGDKSSRVDASAADLEIAMGKAMDENFFADDVENENLEAQGDFLPPQQDSDKKATFKALLLRAWVKLPEVDTTLLQAKATTANHVPLAVDTVMSSAASVLTDVEDLDAKKAASKKSAVLAIDRLRHLDIASKDRATRRNAPVGTGSKVLLADKNGDTFSVPLLYARELVVKGQLLLLQDGEGRIIVDIGSFPVSGKDGDISGKINSGPRNGESLVSPRDMCLTYQAKSAALAATLLAANEAEPGIAHGIIVTDLNRISIAPSEIKAWRGGEERENWNEDVCANFQDISKPNFCIVVSSIIEATSLIKYGLLQEKSEQTKLDCGASSSIVGDKVTYITPHNSNNSDDKTVCSRYALLMYSKSATGKKEDALIDPTTLWKLLTAIDAELDEEASADDILVWFRYEPKVVASVISDTLKVSIAAASVIVASFMASTSFYSRVKRETMKQLTPKQCVKLWNGLENQTVEDVTVSFDNRVISAKMIIGKLKAKYAAAGAMNTTPSGKEIQRLVFKSVAAYALGATIKDRYDRGDSLGDEIKLAALKLANDRMQLPQGERFTFETVYQLGMNLFHGNKNNSLALAQWATSEAGGDYVGSLFAEGKACTIAEQTPALLIANARMGYPAGERDVLAFCLGVTTQQFQGDPRKALAVAQFAATTAGGNFGGNYVGSLFAEGKACTIAEQTPALDMANARMEFPPGKRDVLAFCLRVTNQQFPDDQRKALAVAQFAATTAGNNLHKVATATLNSLSEEQQTIARDAGESTLKNLGDRPAKGAIMTSVKSALRKDGLTDEMKLESAALAVALSSGGTRKQARGAVVTSTAAAARVKLLREAAEKRAAENNPK